MDPSVGIRDEKYYSVEAFSHLLEEKNCKFFIFNFNVRSFSKNSDEICGILGKLSNRPDVIVFTETWFTEGTVAELDGYNSFHTYRNELRGGGVSIYVSKQYSGSYVSQWSYVDVFIEMCTVNIKVRDDNIVVHGIYRPPDMNVRVFNERLSNLLDDVRQTKHVFLVGDFNLDSVNQTAPAVDFSHLCQSHSFVQLITVPTRVSRGVSTCLDQIWYNQLAEAKSGVLEIDVTDHYPAFTIVPLLLGTDDFIIKRFRDHSDASLRALRDDIEIFVGDCNQTLFREGVCINEAMELFIDGVYAAYDKCCRIRTKRIVYKRNMKPWITDSLIDCIRRKHRLFRDYKRGVVDYNYYNSFKDLVNKLLRRTKVKYFAGKFDAVRGDSAATWKIINSLTNNKSKRTSPCRILFNGNPITDPVDIASNFNNYFSAIAEQLDNRIVRSDRTPISYMSPRVDATFFVSPIIAADICDVINKLKCSSKGLNSTPTYILKFLADLLSPIIAELFNMSISSGQFPDVLKLARVVPVYKAGDPEDQGNYRPISNLTDFSKIFEKVMYKQFMSFVKSNNILNPNQFGFQKSSSTSDAIVEYLDNLYQTLNFRKSAVSVFLDFSKAFDTVKHEVLIDKLEHLGVRGLVLRWFSSYLSNRQQYVSVGGYNSSRSHIRMGVPQGSVLGPLLFLLYINDMSNSSGKLHFIHFADDTTVFMSGKEADILIDEVNVELVHVNEWLCANRLVLNTAKTTTMIISDFGLQNLRPVRIAGVDVEFVHESKFLGVIIDDKLSFNRHVEKLSSTVSRSLGMLNRMSDFIPQSVKLNIYYSIIYSRITYAILAWGQSGLGNIARINRLLRRAHKWVLFPYYSEEKIAQEFLKFQSVYDYFAAMKLYKILKLGHHSYFAPILNNLEPQHDHRTRFRSHYRFNVPKLNKSKCQRCFLYQAIRIWNSLSELTKSSCSLKEFKGKLKKEILHRQLLPVLS